MPPRKILLVEKDEFYVEVIQTFIKLFLQQQLIPVREVHRAFDAVKHDRPDLVLLDLEADSQAALEFSEKMRDDTDTKRIPVLAISHVHQLRDEALGRGCSAFLEKPFKVRELEAIITRLLERP